MAASHMKVSRLIAIVDYNNVQLDGFVSEVMDIAPLAAKWRAFGWEVVEINGHAVGEVSRGLDLAIQLCEESPVVIIAKTIKGKGVSFMENKAQWHGSVPNEDEYQQAMNELSSGC